MAVWFGMISATDKTLHKAWVYYNNNVSTLPAKRLWPEIYDLQTHSSQKTKQQLNRDCTM